MRAHRIRRVRRQQRGRRRPRWSRRRCVGGQVYTAGANHGGTGNCAGPFTTVADSETIWAACFSYSAVAATGPGYTKGADNGGGDWAEYRISTDPAGTLETPTFENPGQYMLDVIELRPQ